MRRYYIKVYNVTTGVCMGYVRGVMGGGLVTTVDRREALYRMSRSGAMRVSRELLSMYGFMGYDFRVGVS